MNDENINKGHTNFIVALLLLFPVVIGSVKIAGNLILLILVFMGIYIFFKEKKSPFKVPELKLFSWLTFVYFVVMLLSIVQNEGFVDDLSHIGRKAHFLLAPLIALAIYKANFSLDKLLISLKLGLIIVGSIVIYEFNMGYNRPSGMLNANVFGDIAVIMFFLCIVNFSHESMTQKLFTIFAVCIGFGAILLPQNRGSWLVFIALLLIFLWLNFRYSINKKAPIILFVIVTLIGIGVTLNVDIVSKRTEAALNGALEWSNGNFNSSTGERLEMWHAGLSAARDSPLTGYGYRKANDAAQKYTEQDIKGYSHLHNEYITNLVSAGIFGLVSVLALLFIPLLVFLKSIKNNKTFVISIMGVLLCSGYAFIGLTHIAFGEEHMNAFYVFFLAILLPSVIQTRSK